MRNPHLAGILDEQVVMLVVVVLDLLSGGAHVLLPEDVIEHLLDDHRIAHAAHEQRVGLAVGGDILTGNPGEPEFAHPLHELRLRDGDLAALGFVDQKLPINQVLDRILPDRARFLGRGRVDHACFSLCVFVHLRRGDRMAVHGNYDRILRIGLDQRDDPQEALLPGQIRAAQVGAEHRRLRNRSPRQQEDGSNRGRASD
jgi:hypothetical protein